MKPENLIGREFGRLKVQEYCGSNKHGQAQWKCNCVCGNTPVVVAHSLKTGHTRSCGCLVREITVGSNSIVCLVCGKEKDVIKSEVKRGGGKYCSRKCRSIGDRKNKEHPTTTDGYALAYAPNHPNARYGGYILKHRLMIEESIGRILKDNEVVHHINRDKLDNRVENLQILSPEEHSKLHNFLKGSTAMAEFVKERVRERYELV